MTIRHAIIGLGAAAILLCGTTTWAQLFEMEMVPVPAADVQPGGPAYDFEIGRAEVTNAQFAAFLNDAELHNETQNPGNGNERGANMLFRPPPFGGDVGLVVGDSGDVDAIFDISRSLLTHAAAMPVGQRFGVTPGKEDHPVTGVSWIGAVKFGNWLTIDQGLGLGARCYAEGPSELDWFPVTIGSEIGGTQQATNQARDLTEAERLQWVTECRGYRLPMDQGGTAVGGVNAVPRPYNEWYKAAAFDPAAPDVPRLVFPGFPFEEHTVPPDHWVHSYGRDPLTNADANFRDSGDPFDDPDPAVIATTPAGYYDGTDHGGVFPTTASANRYGAVDMSGNVWELLNDQVTTTDSLTPDRSLAGGSYRSNAMQVSSANRGDIGPGTTRPVVGLRVLRVPRPACSPPAGTPLLSLEAVGNDVRLDWTVLADATAYDVVRGELGPLRTGGGDFTAATVECLADDATATSLIYAGEPPPGEAFWFLVRGSDCGGGTYDSGSASQEDSRDVEIEASAGACVPFGGFEFEVMARTGDEPPERPGESFTTFTDPDLNDVDQVVFKGNFDGPASGNEGIYLWIAGTLSRVVDDSFDSSPPGQSGATSWTSFGPPVVNQAGSILFHGNFSFGDNSQGLYHFTAATESVIFDDNPLQPVPGQPGAQGFTVFPFTAGILPLLADDGSGATTARYDDAVFVERVGVYVGDSGSGIVRAADETLAPPGQPNELFDTFDPFMSTNGTGDVAFQAGYTGGGNGMYRYVRSTDTLLRVADSRLVPPGQVNPARFGVVDGFPSMNDSGLVAFRASYTNGTGDMGIYVGDGAGTLDVVVDDSGAFPVPGRPGETFTAFGFPALSAAGDVFFTATYGGGFGVYRSASGILEKVVDSGDPVPQQLGATFFAIGNLSVSIQGHVAFTARYSDGLGDEGLYFHDGTSLRRVIDESDSTLGLAIENLHMLTTTGSSGGAGGKPNALGASGSIAFRVTLAGGDEAVLLASPR